MKPSQLPWPRLPLPPAPGPQWSFLRSTAWLASYALLLVAAPLACSGCGPVGDIAENVGVCLWADVGAVTEAPVAAKPGRDCLRVTAPDGARISAEPLDPCDADELGEWRVVVPRGASVYRYSSPNIAPGAYQASWVVCPTETP